MKVSFRWTHVIMLICKLLAICSSPPAMADLVYNPRTDVKLCGRGGRPSWLCDPFYILSREQADELDFALEEIRSTTSCACTLEQACNVTDSGYTISIAILPYLPSTRQDPVTARNYADFLRKKSWMFGKCEDDVVIVVAKQDKEVYASAGPAAALKLKLLIMEDIYSDTRQYFQDEDVFTGLKVMVESFRSVLQDSYSISPDFPVWPIVQMGIGALFVLICFCSMYLCRKLFS
ncbi:uncharacterized protein LOC121430037 [Lytechinus variegatus]|uniref:uncharacterized protein LOC121430037 n=1 Tax=Lytechinus variegatus TaxID=7654 RepID=UPI001BB1277E|nr:uncharacterized protein LOC121430037 [Lytechinus variegatus]